MKSPRILHWLCFTIIGITLCLTSPVYAVGDPLINQARDQLHQAWNPDGGQISDDDKIALLQSALALLQKSSAIYHGQRQKAIQDVKEAISLLKNGNPDNKATGLIHDAIENLRDIT